MADEKIIPPCFVGELLISPFERELWRVAQDFRFIDKNHKQWAVPAGMLTDGASIPAPLQLIFGHPFMGDYVEAAVIHDFYCEKRIEPWRETHEMFFQAMIVGGTSQLKAKAMFAGVLFGNRKWSTQTVVTSRLSQPSDIMYSVYESDFQMEFYETVSIGGKSARDVLRGNGMWGSGNETEMDFDHVYKLIQKNDPSLAEIELAVRTATELIEPPYSVIGQERLRTIVVSESNHR